MTSIGIDERRLLADLEGLGRFGRNAGGGIDRASFSVADVEARAWLTARCEDAGLRVERDGAGNLIVSSPRLDEGVADRAAVWTGSHIDAVPDGGAFDGALGVVAAVEVLRSLHESGIRLARPVRAVSFSDEEGSFAHLFGSTAVAKGFAEDELARMTGRDGVPLADALRDALGLSIADVAAAGVPAGGVDAYVELHIEQGPTLEQTNVPIGVVTGIVAIGGGTVRFTGRADHAGTTPMDRRRDAGLAAAEFALSLPGIAAEVGAGAVVTTGIMRFDPAGSNVIPGAAEVSVDFRDAALERAEELGRRIAAAAEAVGARRGVGVTVDFEPTVPGAPMDDEVRAVIAASAERLGLASVAIASGAGHDAQNMATVSRAGMIFVPSTGGRSHSPAEWTPDADVVRGTRVLLETVRELAQR